jgi:hypothetical protein
MKPPVDSVSLQHKDASQEVKNQVFQELLRKSRNGVLLEKLLQSLIFISELFNDYGLKVNSQLIKALRLLLLVERKVDVGVSQV